MATIKKKVVPVTSPRDVMAQVWQLMHLAEDLMTAQDAVKRKIAQLKEMLK